MSNHSVCFEPGEIDEVIEDDDLLAVMIRLHFASFARLLEEDPGLVQPEADPGQIEVPFDVMEELCLRPNAEVAAYMRALRVGT